jgi:hypothetical protein
MGIDGSPKNGQAKNPLDKRSVMRYSVAHERETNLA